MGLALLFGISERLFVTIVEGMEGKLGVPAAAPAAPAATTPAKTT